MDIKNAFKRLLRPPHVECVLRAPREGALLDIGCGNHSPSRTKALRSDLHYVGVDIQDYNLSAEDMVAADELVRVSADSFHGDIGQRLAGRQFDLILVKHVLEHLREPESLLDTLIPLLAPGGQLYLSFPCERSVSFPSAEGTLNFYDDPTHVQVPPFGRIRAHLRAACLEERKITQRYRHPVYLVLGVVSLATQLPRWIATKKLRANPLLWSLFGFESILLVRKAMEPDA